MKSLVFYELLVIFCVKYMQLLCFICKITQNMCCWCIIKSINGGAPSAVGGGEIDNLPPPAVFFHNPPAHRGYFFHAGEARRAS